MSVEIGPFARQFLLGMQGGGVLCRLKRLGASRIGKIGIAFDCRGNCMVIIAGIDDLILVFENGFGFGRIAGWRRSFGCNASNGMLER